MLASQGEAATQLLLRRVVRVGGCFGRLPGRRAARLGRCFSLEGGIGRQLGISAHGSSRKYGDLLRRISMAAAVELLGSPIAS